MVALGTIIFRRWLGYENGILVDGINILIKATPENTLAPSTMRTVKTHHVRTRKWAFTRLPNYCVAPWYWPSSFRSLRNKFFIHKLPRLWYSDRAMQTGSETIQLLIFINTQVINFLYLLRSQREKSLHSGIS
jgi:hypothetical protein